MDRPSLVQAVRNGAWAVTACQIASQLVSIVTLAILYRWLEPRDFGLFAMVLVALNFGRLFATWGLGVASVQDQELTDAEQSILCHDGLRVATLTAVCLGLLAKPIAWFFAEPKVFEVLLALLLTLIILAAGTQHQSRLERKLRLGKLAMCRLTSQLIGALAAVIAAMAGLGIWTFVVQQFVESITLTAALWLAEPWWPFNYPTGEQSVVRLRRFGRHYTLSGLMFWIAQNIDTVIVGRWGGDVALGFYSQAFSLMMKPVLLVTTTVSGVMLPTLSRARTNAGEYRQLLVGFYRFVGLLLLPCSMGLFVVAEDVMLVLGGENWSAAGTLLRALAPVIAAQGFINIAGSVFASAGRADRLLAGATAIALLLAQGVAAGWWLGTLFGTPPLAGTLGVAWGYSLVTVVVIFLPYLWFCLTTVGVSVHDVFAAIARPAAMSLLMGIAVWGISGSLAGTAPAVRLATCVIAGASIYGALMWREIRSLSRGN